MSTKTKARRKTGLFVALCIGVFLVSAVGGVVSKMAYTYPGLRKYKVVWNDTV